MTVYVRSGRLSDYTDPRTGHHEEQFRYRLTETDGLDVERLHALMEARLDHALRDALRDMGIADVKFQRAIPVVSVLNFKG